MINIEQKIKEYRKEKMRLKEKKIRFIHIGKTGGSFAWFILNKIDTENKLILNGHANTLNNENYKYIFFIRDPVTRYISSFISRLRKGKPLYNVEWTHEEKIAYTNFKTPNELAESLSPTNSHYKEALHAMHSVFHLKHDISYYLKDVETIKKYKDKIIYIGKQETINEDINSIVKLLGYDYTITDEDMTTKFIHKTPDNYKDITWLSELGRQNVINYYKKDYEIITRRHY